LRDDEGEIPELPGPPAEDPDSSLPSETFQIEELVAQIDSGATLEMLPATRKVSPDEARGGALEAYMSFALGEARYAVSLASVVEIGRVPPVTPVPNVPEWVRGVINMRGDILSLVDLGLFFGTGGVKDAPSRRLIAIHAGRDVVTAGLLVDQVTGVVNFPAAEIAPPAGPVASKVALFSRGVARHGGMLVALLDIEKLFASPEMRQFEGNEITVGR
jgi:purine-binding chemotaxis protein CheW